MPGKSGAFCPPAPRGGSPRARSYQRKHVPIGASTLPTIRARPYSSTTLMGSTSSSVRHAASPFAVSILQAYWVFVMSPFDLTWYRVFRKSVVVTSATGISLGFWSWKAFVLRCSRWAGRWSLTIPLRSERRLWRGYPTPHLPHPAATWSAFVSSHASLIRRRSRPFAYSSPLYWRTVMYSRSTLLIRLW